MPSQLTFTIPGNPPVKVVATENAGKLDFVVDVQDTQAMTGDLRGFFIDFNEAKMAGMKVSGGALLTSSKVGINQALDLGNGATMAAKTAAKFDIGIELGTAGIAKDDVSGAVTFTLSNNANNLTLADIAGQRFGAKVDSLGAVGSARTGTETITGNAPALSAATTTATTPATTTTATGGFAKADTFAINEDGAGSGSATLTLGAAAASTAPKAVTLDVLANDTGGKAALTISGIATGPKSGTVTIAADGKSLLYTPNANVSGTDTLTYKVVNAQGQAETAVATINIAAIADAAKVTTTVDAGKEVNQTIVHVAAALTDTDGSEYISSIVAKGVPAGVTVAAIGALTLTATGATQDFLVTNAATQSAKYDVVFSAESKERSNANTAVADVARGIDYSYKTQTVAMQFQAVDQSVWSSGGSINIEDHRFYGVDYSFDKSIDLGVAELYGKAGVKLGLQSDLKLDSGTVNASAIYDVTVATAFNRTTDVLKIDTSKALDTAAFTTTSPEGYYYLTLIHDVFAKVGIEIAEVADLKLLELNLFDTPKTPLIALDSANVGFETELPEPFDFAKIKTEWPTVSTEASGHSTSLSSAGYSNNFVQLDISIVDMVWNLYIADLKKAAEKAGKDFPDIPNPFHQEFEESGVEVSYNLFDIIVSLGAAFHQTFDMTLGALHGDLTFENGTSRAFTVGDSITLQHASTIDAAGNHDGAVNFGFDLAPDATLHNQTGIGVNVGFELTAIEGHVKVDVPYLPTFGFDIGPLVEYKPDPWRVGDINIYDNKFALHFEHSSLQLAA